MKSRSDSLDGPGQARLVSPVLDPSKLSELSPREAVIARRSKPSGPRLGRLFLIVLILAAVAFAIGFIPRAKEKTAVQTETRELALPTIEVAAPAPGKVGPPLLFSGEVKPLSEAAIHARVSGYVRRWLVDIGAQVGQGQLLAELDTPELDRDLAHGRAELAQAEAARALAETTAKRWIGMRAAKTVSPQETDEKVADLALKKATVEAARAQVQRLEEMLRFNTITAPFAGTVTMRMLDVGQLVTGGAGRELFRIAQADRLRVFVRIPQNYARAVTVGQTAELVFTELPGRTFEAKVVRTAGTLDAASRTLLTELEVDNAKGELLAGSYVQVRFKEAKLDALLVVGAGPTGQCRPTNWRWIHVDGHDNGPPGLKRFCKGHAAICKVLTGSVQLPEHGKMRIRRPEIPKILIKLRG